MLHIGGLFSAMLISIVFMLFLNGDIGWAMIYILGGTAVASLVMFLISKRHFEVELEELSGVTECGRRIDIVVELKKKGFCMLPFIELTINTDSGELPIKLRTALIFGEKKRVSASFHPSHCGLNRVTLVDASVYDFLGLARKRIKLGLCTQKAVLPRRIEYDGPEVLPNMLPSEEEEIEEGITSQNGGMPGYEHREYVPGDSPRRVNYKLSAKRHRLMVRLDESQGSASTNLYIAANALPVCADKAFALASRLVIRGGTVKVTHKGAEQTAATPETLDRMREWLAFREFGGSAGTAETVPADAAVIFSGSGTIAIAPSC